MEDTQYESADSTQSPYGESDYGMYCHVSYFPICI
jgi:hypothetical protein